MPHAVLIGKPSIEDIFKELRPLMIKDERGILRTMDSYLERTRKSILIESLPIQENRTVSFLAMISGREDGVVIRLYPKHEVEKTDGVKRLLAELAKQLLETFPDFKLGETNLKEYFP
jgi:hypothetical protein